MNQFNQPPQRVHVQMTAQPKRPNHTQTQDPAQKAREADNAARQQGKQQSEHGKKLIKAVQDLSKGVKS